MENWFTSDLHFGHENIIKYCNRPYANTDEMDEAIFKSLATTVPAGATLWVLGDVAMKNRAFAQVIASRLHQLPFKTKIISGNHDKGKTKIFADFLLLEHDGGRHIYELEGKTVSMGHYPVETGAKESTLYLNGHVHEKWKFEMFGTPEAHNVNCNVGVDVWDMKPVRLDEIIKQRDEYYLSKFNK